MPTLVYVKQDREFTRIKRRGRIQIPTECARDPKHFHAAIELAKKLLVEQLGIEDGARHIESVAWEVRGPLQHIAHFLSDSPDSGPLVKMPEITNLGNYDREAMDRYERAEKARRAWEAGEVTDMEDYRVIGVFEVPIPQQYRAHVKETRR